MRNLFIFMCCIGFANISLAKEDPHKNHHMHHDMHKNHHGMQQKEKPIKSKRLERIKKYPKSGEARELGFDDVMFMESTTVHNDIQTKCAHAERGLIILDRATWSKCGARPDGLIVPKESKHEGHQHH